MKDLLTLTSLSRTEIHHILDIATQMRRIVLASNKKSPQLLGKTLVGLFSEDCNESVAFDLACKYLSGTCAIVKTTDNWLEVAKNVEAMGANFIAAKNSNDNLLATMANVTTCSVINVGSKMYSPVTALADLMVLQTKLDGLQQMTVGVVGNGKTNVIADLDYALQLYKSNLIWYLPKDDVVTQRKGIVLDSIDSVFAGADAVIDIGLAQYTQGERYYGTNFGIPKETFDKARSEIPLLGTRFIVDKKGISEYYFNTVSAEASCYVAVAMAVMYLFT